MSACRIGTEGANPAFSMKTEPREPKGTLGLDDGGRVPPTAGISAFGGEEELVS